MATIKNTINTQFTSSGATKVVKDTESVSRVQTRLGQASASNGRQFAAQANGLGGLVAAYAGAAATVFALEAAFTALSRAAQSETILQGTNTLAREIGQSGPKILESIKSITQGQLTLTEAAQNANIALSAGFDTQQIEGLTEVALKASRALGRDLTDSFQRVVRGVAKLEPELLDEIGIFTRLDPAVQKYARQLGVSAKTLNEFQRRQAFANATIEEGLRKFGNIDTTSASTQKTLEQLRVQVSELATEFTKIIVSALVPFVNFFKDDIGNALLLFGGITALVFGKALSIIGDWSRNSIQNVSNFAALLATKAAEARGSFGIITQGVTELNAAISSRKGLSKDDGRFNQIGVERAVATEAAQARQRFISGQQLAPTQITADIKALTAVQAQLAKEGRQSTAAYADATKIINTYSAALQTAGTRTKVLTGLSVALSGAVKLAAKAFSILAGTVNALFLVVGVAQLVGTLFDIDLLSAVKSLFTDLSQAAENLKTGFSGLVVSAGGGSEALINQLKLVGATEADLEALPATIAAIRKEIDAGATDTLQKSLDPITSLGGAGAAAVTQVTLTDAERILQVEKAIADARAEILAPGMFTSQDAIENLRQRVIILNAYKSSLENFGSAYGRLIGELALVTGASAESIATSIDTGFGSLLQKSQNSLRVLGVEVGKIDGQLSLESLTQGQRAVVEAGVLMTGTIKEVDATLASSNVNTDKLGASIGGLQSQLDIATIEYNKQKTAIDVGVLSTVEAIEANKELRVAIGEVQDRIDVYINIQKELLNLERVYKSVLSTFSKEISAFENIETSGLVNALGQIANTQQEIDANQAAYLRNLAESTRLSYILASNEGAREKYFTSLNASAEDRLAIEAKINAEAELYGKTIEAINGKILSIIQSAKTLTAEFNNATKEIRLEIAGINAQRALFQIEAKIDINKLQRDLALAQEQAKLERLELQVDLVSAKEDSGALKPLEAAVQTNALEQQILAQRRTLIDLEYANNIAAINEENRLLLAKFDLVKKEITAQADLQKAKIAADAANVQALISTYSAFITDQQAVSEVLAANFVGAGNAVAKALATTLTNGAAQFANAILTGQAGAVTAGVAEAVPVEKITGDLGTVGAELRTATVALLESIDERTAAEIAAEQERTNAAILANAERIKAENNAHGNKLANLSLESQIEAENAKTRADKASKAGEDELNEIEKRLQALFDSIKGSIETALMALNDLIFYGEGNFGDIISNLFKSIQQDLFKITIADPLSTALTDGLFGMLGVTGMRKGIDNAQVLNGALLVSVVSGPADMFGALNSDASSSSGAEAAGGVFGGFFDQITNMFSNVFGSGGIVAKLFSSLFGQGGILSGLFKGLINIISSIFGGGLFAAQGGMVHLAQGGAAVSASLRRDRVPAMLEPGEFVLRKQSARKIGLPALQAMNATGSAGGAGNVFVNVTNEGTPKQTEASQPRFDGEKYVVDIVMRDISNNGPIRRSLRGRGGL